MALIQCPECGKEVSDSAKMCPHCGFGVAAQLKNQALQEQTEATKQKASEITGSFINILKRHKIIVGIVCGIILALSIAFLIVCKMNNEVEKIDYTMSYKKVKSILGKADNFLSFDSDYGYTYYDYFYYNEYFLGIKGSIHISYHDNTMSHLFWCSDADEDKVNSNFEKIKNYFVDKYGECDKSSSDKCDWGINEDLSISVWKSDSDTIYIDYYDYNYYD